MRTCTCPVGTYITTLGTLSCPESFGQIQKFIFWRAGNSIADVATMILTATWTGLKAATDSTKAVVTPYVGNPTGETGAARTFGGGNETRNGIPIIFGAEPTKLSSRLYEYTASIIRNIKELACENLEVIFINENGHFGHRLDGTAVKGFPIQAFFCSDKNLGGYSSPDWYNLEFQMAANWSDYFTVTDPTANFNALTL